MDWAEFGTAAAAVWGLLGGSIGLILGRVWDNRREDRYRHVEVKREAAVEFLEAVSAFRDAVIERVQDKKAISALPPKPTDVDDLKQLRERLISSNEKLGSVAERAELAQQRVFFLFGQDALRPAVALTQALIEQYDTDQDDRSLVSPFIDDFKDAARRELGLDRTPWVRKLWTWARRSSVDGQ